MGFSRIFFEWAEALSNISFIIIPRPEGRGNDQIFIRSARPLAL
jgi:hypothetical protein